MKRSDEKRWFKTILDIIREHRACALASVNVEHLLSCWQIGGVLSAKIKQDGWGRATINCPAAGWTIALSLLGGGKQNFSNMGHLEFYWIELGIASPAKSQADCEVR